MGIFIARAGKNRKHILKKTRTTGSVEVGTYDMAYRKLYAVIRFQVFKTNCNGQRVFFGRLQTVTLDSRQNRGENI